MDSHSTRFVTELPWSDALVPQGIPVPSSILLSGPSGTGKSFGGLTLAASWLRQGGKVIFMPMHSAFAALFEKGLRDLLLLSPSYGHQMFLRLLDTVLDARHCTHLFTMSSDVLMKQSIELGRAADHLVSRI